MIQLLLGATLAAHAAATGACRAISRPAQLFYLVAMMLVPLQGIFLPATFSRSLILALSAPFYVAFMALVARRNHDRARAAIHSGPGARYAAGRAGDGQAGIGPRPRTGRGRKPRQITVPRQYEPRTAHAAERDPGLLGNDHQPALRQGARAQCGICRPDQLLRQASSHPDQRHSRPGQDRGRALAAGGRRG